MSKFSSPAASNRSAASQNASATIALMVVVGLPMESEEPTIRNSNLFPVKANGEVRFLSVASIGRSGTVETPVCNVEPSRQERASPVSTSCLTTSSSCVPRNMETIAGGASLACPQILVHRMYDKNFLLCVFGFH